MYGLLVGRKKRKKTKMVEGSIFSVVSVLRIHVKLIKEKNTFNDPQQ